jgi:hypothetical protein
LILAISVRRGIEVLRGNNSPSEKVLVALVCYLREVTRSFRHLELSSRLIQLLINLRSINLSKNIASLNPRADVKVPFLQVATGLSEYRRFNVGSGLAG